MAKYYAKSTASSCGISYEKFCRYYAKESEIIPQEPVNNITFSRYVRFEHFRNIGFGKNEKKNELLLNAKYEEGKAGNLIVLIGANNSGKSNILDGICEIKTGIIENDITTLTNYITDEYKNPNVSLVYKSKDRREIKYSAILNSQNKWDGLEKIEKNSDNTTTKIENVLLDSDKIKEDLSFIKSFVGDYRHPYFDYWRDGNRIVGLVDDLIQQVDSGANIEEIFHQYENLLGNIHIYSNYCDLYENLRKNFRAINYILEKSGEVDISGLPGIINIHRYVQGGVDDRNLNADVNQFRANPIFKSLFNYIEEEVGQKPEEMVSNALKQSEKYGDNYSVLDKCSEKINSAIQKVVNKRFNELYLENDNEGYRFQVRLDARGVHLSISRGDNPVVLQNQSTGFKWFFNFFFNFILNNDLKAGDIVIMDEPAINLHPEGQRELRKFIKGFAIENDILFIIATHSPFLIDIDNYDELRVVSLIDSGEVKIDNSFSAVNLGDPDTLLPIKRALTIRQNVLYECDTEVIWVEGITDYNYLTMFKKLFANEKYNNLAFLPFNGVGGNDNEAGQILEKLKSVKFHKCGVLTDGDKAGKKMFELAKNSNFYNYNISEIGDGKFNEIEDLFSSKDKEKYTFLKEKKSYLSADLKNHSRLEDFSKETMDNFRNLFDYFIG